MYVQAGSYAEVVRCLEPIERQVQACDSVYGAASALILLADAYRLMGRQADARGLLDRIDAASLEPESAAEHDLLCARLWREEGRYADCVARFARQGRTARSRADVSLQVVVAQCLQRLNDLGEARAACEWAIVESTRLRWEEGTADATMSLALYDRMEGHWSRAENLLLQARDRYRKLGLSQKYTQTTLNLGVQRLKCGQLRFAEEVLAESVTLSLELGDKRTETSARTARALVLTRLDRLVESRAEFSRALRLARRQASPRRTALALEFTGEYHLASGSPRRARLALERALRIARRIAPDGDIIPEVLRRLAEVELAASRPEAALAQAREAAERAARSGDRYEEATALRVLGQAWRASGDETQAREILHRALEIQVGLDERFERNRVEALLGLPLTVSDDAPAAPADAPSGSPRPRRRPRRDRQGLLREHGLVGRSPALVELFDQVRRIARARMPVLITGETGTGKELIAHAVHRLSPWAEGPLVSFNCATCPRDLLDAELFGYEPGAFTGATRRRLGLARSAAGGSLFLDEVADLPPESQARLLRLLDPGEVRPLGADRSYPVETRIISATNADLDELARAGRFRDDLLYRLAQVRLHVPPLRKRRQDIPLLIEHFVAEVRQTSPQFRGIAPEAVERMKAHDWPGNVRQLRGEVFAVAALAGDGRVKSWRPPCEAPPPRPPVKAALPELTPEIMREALSRSGGSIRAAALRLDVSRGRLQRAIREAGIDPNEMRQPS